MEDATFQRDAFLCAALKIARDANKRGNDTRPRLKD